MKFYSSFLKKSEVDQKVFLEITDEILLHEHWLQEDEICIKVVNDKIELINQSKAIRDRKK